MMNEKTTTANKAIFFGIITGFIFLVLILWANWHYLDTAIPFAVFIGILLTAIGLLLGRPFAGVKKAKD